MKLSLLLSVFLILVGCASVVDHHPSELLSSSAPGARVLKTLARPVEVTLDTGYSRSLKSGSQWILVGRVKEGEVYKPHNDIFTLEGAHVHEANLVVANGQLVGFYLPVERGFSPLGKKVSLTFN